MITVEILRAGQIDKTLEVDQPIFRIGDDPAATIRVPCDEPHLLTVVARDGVAQVINRSERALMIAGRPLAPQATIGWPLGGELLLGDDLTLRLRGGRREVALSRRRRVEKTAPAPTEAAAPDKESAARKDRSTTALLACVTVSMMGLILGMSSPDNRLSETVQFQSVIASLASLDDPRFQHVRSLLQEGRAFEVRGMNSESVTNYAEALKILKASHGSIGTGKDPGTARTIQQGIVFADASHLRVAR